MRRIWNLSTRDKRQSFVGDEGLVKPDYDTSVVKSGWCNIIFNNDVVEGNLKLSKVELKGSHLYIYKHLTISKFNLPSADESKTTNGEPSDAGATLVDGASIVGDVATMETNVPAPHDVRPPEPHVDKSMDITAFKNLNNNSSLLVDQQSIHSQKVSLLLVAAEQTIVYHGNGIHPQLNYDFHNNRFVDNDVALEPLVHFILFHENTNVIFPMINILPVLPEFSKSLLLVQQYLNDSQSSPYIASIADRVLLLLNNIQSNFMGFLLKNDVAPEVIKIIEIMTRILDDPILLGRLKEFKQRMVYKQQELLSVVTIHNNNIDAVINPFVDMNSLMFMKCNLFQLTNTISLIDQKVFQKWNSNIDKSLLLLTSINDPLYKKNPLIFNNDIHIHYLARLLINHLFVETSSSLERKARLLEKWIDLGCLLDKQGNMSSWLGISSIVLSQPVLRLYKIWSLVSSDYIKLLKNDWSPVLFELDRRHMANNENKREDDSGERSPNANNGIHTIRDSYHIMAPRGLGKIYSKESVIPYFGDLVINNESININEMSSVWKRINYSFSRWNEYLQNLQNCTDIIAYNKDVLSRYDSMGFIFSNESLNQVLYNGNNANESLPFEHNQEEKLQKTSGELLADLEHKLIKLIEINCESINLEKIMKLSLALEPDLPEAYLKPPTSPPSSNSGSQSSATSITLHTNNSTSSVVTLSNDDPINKLPTFNNKYFKLNLSKYDELTLTNNNQQHGDLVFRIDDFVTDSESVTGSILDELEPVADDDDGLGIDVDDILNSEKFINFSLKSDDAIRLSDITSKSSPFKYIPKYASIDKLIDLLLIDARYFEDGIQLDLTEYRFVFLLNYNSFITTKDVLDKLAYRFVNSGNAVISIMKKNSQAYNVDLVEFPNWKLDTSVNLKELGPINYELLLKIQINILKVLIALVNNFYANFSLDLTNKSILIKLLKLFSNEILQWYNSNKIDHTLEKSFENLVNYYKKLKKLFVKKSYRPIEINKFDEYLINEFKFNNSLHEVPINRNLPSYKNVVKIEKFLSKFNKLLTIFYKGIKPEDWIKIFKLMESLFEQKRMFEFNLQRPSTPDEYLLISNVFHYFESLVDANEKQLILKKFPLVFRKLFKLYFKFKSYLFIQLTDANITNDERLDRMKTLLSMIKISRIKMSDNLFVFESVERDMTIPSCIETAVTNVIYSPESRSFGELWVRAATSFYNDPVSIPYINNLDTLLPPNLSSSDLQSTEPLLPCFGWIIENLIETNKCPSFYKPGIINFNKRYLIFKLIKELVVEDIDPTDTNIQSPSHASSSNFEFHEQHEFEFLLKLDDTLLEKNSNFCESPDQNRVLFHDVLQEQHQILTNDNKKKSANESLSVATTINTLGKRNSNTQLRRQTLAYKTNSASRFKIAGLFGKARPFSVNGTTMQLSNTIASPTDNVIQESELPDVHQVSELRQKPSAVLTLKNKKIFLVYLLPLCFKIDTDSGDEYVFQARNEADLSDWLAKLNFANRHWYFSRTLNLKTPSYNLTFGVPISLVCNREHSSCPLILTSLFETIEADWINEVGIYRISSSLSELNNAKSVIDRTGSLKSVDREYDVHVLTSIIKSYFRELPDALLTDEVIEALFDVKRKDDNSGFDKSEDLDAYYQALRMLPKYNYNVLKALLLHLDKIRAASETNKMTASNLATVIGPALTEASSLDSLINKFGFINKILEKLINESVWIYAREDA
jgi:hypothetical protein